ncbi:MAG: hypothetical protein HYU87_10640 [Chloroflexi bacterium]|nr:hypothetical protein [Chloroflexota bacterium]
MSKGTLNQVIQRAVSDAAFRRQLQRDPASALADFDLSKDERSAIASGDPAQLTGLGVDQRMSKAFVIGGLSGSASAAVIGDAGAGANAVLVDESAMTGHGALIDDNAASAARSLIEPDAGHGAGAVIVGDPVSPNVAAFDPETASGDLNTIDAGLLGGTTAAFAETSRTEVTDVNQDANWDAASGVTAFEPAGPSTAGELNVLDAGVAEVDSSFDVQIGTSASATETGGELDSGGDIRPTEY